MSAAAALVCGLSVGAISWYYNPGIVQVSEASVAMWAPPGWEPQQPRRIITEASLYDVSNGAELPSSLRASGARSSQSVSALWS